MSVFTTEQDHSIFLNSMDCIDIVFEPLDVQNMNSIVTDDLEFTRKDLDNLSLTIQVQMDLQQLENLFNFYQFDPEHPVFPEMTNSF